MKEEQNKSSKRSKRFQKKIVGSINNTEIRGMKYQDRKEVLMALYGRDHKETGKVQKNGEWKKSHL